MEIADGSAAFDRDGNVPLYARAGVAEAWLVVLPEKQVEVYRNPSPRSFRERIVCFPGDNLTVESFGQVPVTRILGTRP